MSDQDKNQNGNGPDSADQNQNGNGPDSADQNQDKAQAPTDPAPDRGEHMIPKSRFDQVVNQRKEAEAALQDVVDGLVEEVPEDRRDLIPDLPPADKIKWIRKATKAGVFGNQGATSGPDATRPGGRPPTDFDKMSPHEMRAQGYK